MTDLGDQVGVLPFVEKDCNLSCFRTDNLHNNLFNINLFMIYLQLCQVAGSLN